MLFLTFWFFYKKQENRGSLVGLSHLEKLNEVVEALYNTLYYLTDRNIECMVSCVTDPSESKSYVDPLNLKVSFMPNWMNQLQIPDIMQSIFELNSIL